MKNKREAHRRQRTNRYRGLGSIVQRVSEGGHDVIAPRIAAIAPTMSTMNSLLQRFLYKGEEPEAPSGDANQGTSSKLDPGSKDDPMDVTPAPIGDRARERSPTILDETKGLLERVRLACSTGGDDNGGKAMEAFLAHVSRITTRREMWQAADDASYASVVWDVASLIWNEALKMPEIERTHALVCHAACDCAIAIAPLMEIHLGGDHAETHLVRLLRTSQIWIAQEDWGRADSCASKANDLASTLQARVDNAGLPAHRREALCLSLIELCSARCLVSMHHAQDILLSSVVGKCKQLCKGIPSGFSYLTKCRAADELYTLGRSLSSAWESHKLEVISVFECALEVIQSAAHGTHATAAGAGARAGDASSSAEGRSKDGLVRMQGKILKSLAHAHLRAKNFSAAQSVLAFLSQIVGETQIRRHGSYQYMAIEALLGLGKCEEALAMLKSTTSASPPPPEALRRRGEGGEGLKGQGEEQGEEKEKGGFMDAHDDADDSMTLEKITLCYAACDPTDQAKVMEILVSCAEATQSRALVLGFLRFLLLRNDADRAHHRTAVTVMADPRVSRLFEHPAASEDCACVFGRLFDAGADDFKSAGCEVLSERLFQASMIYASFLDSTTDSPPTPHPPPTQGEAPTRTPPHTPPGHNKARVLRCLSLLFCKQGQSTRALEYLTLAKDLEPHSILNHLIAIQIAIAGEEKEGEMKEGRKGKDKGKGKAKEGGGGKEGREGAATHACVRLMEDMAAIPGFHPRHLLAVCREAVERRVAHVALAALRQLRDHLRAHPPNPPTGTGLGLTRATLLRCLIHLTQEQAGEGGKGGGGGEGGEGERKGGGGGGEDVTAYLEEAAAAVAGDEGGFLGPAGEGADDTAREATFGWFATAAWNAGLEACDAHDHKRAARAMGVAATFFARLEGRPGRNAQRCNALLFAAAATLEASKAPPSPFPSSSVGGGQVQASSKDAEAGRRRKLVAEVAQRVRALELACVVRPEQGEGAGEAGIDAATADRIRRHLPWLRYELACLSDDASRALQHLNELKESAPFAEAAPFVGMADASRAPTVKAAAYHIALRKYQSAGDCTGVAHCFRMLVEGRASEAEGVKLTEQASQCIANAVPPGAYPPEEIEWLVATAWNQGVHLLRFDERDAGAAWIGAARALSAHMPDAWKQEYAAAMAEYCDKHNVGGDGANGAGVGVGVAKGMAMA